MWGNIFKQKSKASFETLETRFCTPKSIKTLIEIEEKKDKNDTECSKIIASLSEPIWAK